MIFVHVNVTRPIDVTGFYRVYVSSSVDGLANSTGASGDTANGPSPPNAAAPQAAAPPQFFVALARLQLSNLPQAADLAPHRAHEFTTRLSEEGSVTFCDQRLSNLFPGSLLSPASLLGTPFADIVVGAEDKAAFLELFAQGKSPMSSLSLPLLPILS